MSAPARDDLSPDFRPQIATGPVDWIISDMLVDYESAVAFMDARVAAIAEGTAPECVWLLEHPPLYTAGTSADDSDLIAPDRFPVYRTGRGGQHTYHGPGQRVAYVMLDLRRRRQDVRAFVAALEAWVINSLWSYHIRGERREDRVGVWVRRPEKGAAVEDKVAAIGIRLRKWVTFHGISFNVDPDLDHFSGIVPCGIREHGVTSLVDLGIPVTLEENDSVLLAEFEKIFGPARRAEAPELG
ncbi:lipoyl(octanoyl) transferase LipB [Roseibium litorale]|uniref:Octanoyltransferase n=1 Tax=Roseibium litorale TaxID=2803841 RepID=A0ABR9CH66_9HYPH|nr:lipoyl(octanoyl) transferase LipB [Roseibium litorale]MBD8890197.1 lipoyl(octanoyl) transferase LipB [Roseibium litorale]